MKSKVLIGIIILLVGVIGFEIYYIFSHQEDKIQEKSYINIPKEQGDKEEDLPLENNQDITQDYVKLVNVREEESKVIQEYEMVLNGKKQEFSIYFEINEQNDYWGIDAYFNFELIFSDFDDEHQLPENVSDYIGRYFNEKNFIIFSGTDNVNYLIIQDYRFPPAGGVGVEYKIFNQDYEYIGYTDVIYQGQSLVLEDETVWYENTLNIDTVQGYNEIRSKIVGNKIYNLFYNGSCEGGTMEERVYTINQNKLEYEVIGTYEVLEGAGAC